MLVLGWRMDIDQWLAMFGLYNIEQGQFWPVYSLSLDDFVARGEDLKARIADGVVRATDESVALATVLIGLRDDGGTRDDMAETIKAMQEARAGLAEEL